MRLVFMGTPEFALPSLERLVASDHQVVAVVTRPDKPQGRGLQEAPPAVKICAQRLGLPVLQPQSLREVDFIRRLADVGGDLFVVVAFRILPEEIFTMPPKGTIDLHPSLLPKYRGAAPINWAIINGEQQTGISVMFIGKQIDAGDLIVQRTMAIDPEETVGQLSQRLAVLGAEVLLEAVDDIARGTVQRRQQAGGLPTPAPKLGREDGRIDWRKSAGEVNNLIRGLNPKPGAFTTFGPKAIKIWRAQVAGPSVPGARPGEVVKADEHHGILVNTADGQLQLVEVQLEGKRCLRATEFLRGFHLHRGDIFD